MSDNPSCEQVKRSALGSVLLLLVAWLVLLFGGVADALIPSWLSWQVAFMVLLPLGVAGLLYSVASTFRMKSCF
ncbi:hypothetical protein [Endothiovibrio diazotrophicus]